MVKLVYCLRRRAHVSPKEFYRYWLNTHAPKVKDAAEAMRALRYVQRHTCGAELNEAFVVSRGLAPAYDGITEVWWNSIEDVKAAMASPVGPRPWRGCWRMNLTSSNSRNRACS